MKSRLVALLTMLLVVGGLVGYKNRYRLAATIWHWKHGYSASIGNYLVPVPKNWLIFNESSAPYLMNTSPKWYASDGKFHTNAVISFLSIRDRTVRMDYWLSQEKQRLAGEQVSPVEEKSLGFGDEFITCEGGPELNALGKKLNGQRTDAVSLNCMSERGLNILFVGEPSDVEVFYSFLSQIRRKS